MTFRHTRELANRYSAVGWWEDRTQWQLEWRGGSLKFELVGYGTTFLPGHSVS